MDNYFKVIDGIKYDVNQSIAICEGQISRCGQNYLETHKTKLFRTIVHTTTRYIYTDKCTVRKGINGNYFLDIITYYQKEETDGINHSRKLIEEQEVERRVIRPINRDEAVEIYFNGYRCNGDWYCCVIQMKQLLNENEAFEGIPVA